MTVIANLRMADVRVSRFRLRCSYRLAFQLLAACWCSVFWFVLKIKTVAKKKDLVVIAVAVVVA